MQYIISLINIGICIAGLTLSRSIFAIFWAIAFFIVLSIGYDYYTASYNLATVAFANLYSMCFNFIFLMCQLIFFHNDEIKKISVSDSIDRRVSIICVFLAITGVVFFFLSVPGTYSDIVSFDWEDISDARVGIYVLTGNISNFSIIMSSSLFIPYLLNKKYKTSVVIVILGYLFILLISKTKSYILPLIFSLLVYISLIRSRWFSWYMLKIFMSLVAVFIFLYIGTQAVRYGGTLQNLMTAGSFETKEIILRAAEVSVESELTKAYYMVVEYYERNELLHGSAFSRFALLPLSFVFKIDVPENPMYVYGDITFTASTGLLRLLRGSNHPTIYGDAYANFGGMGVLLGAFYAVLIGIIWKIAVALKNFALFSTISGCCYGIPLIVRGSVFYGLYGIILTMVLGILINYLVFVFPKDLKISSTTQIRN